jgi:hypothetical protein
MIMNDVIFRRNQGLLDFMDSPELDSDDSTTVCIKVNFPTKYSVIVSIFSSQSQPLIFVKLYYITLSLWPFLFAVEFLIINDADCY